MVGDKSKIIITMGPNLETQATVGEGITKDIGVDIVAIFT